MSSIDPDTSYTQLENWLKTHTGYVNNLVCKNVPGSGRGLFAPRDMREGEVLLEIPPSAMLNPLTVRGKSDIPEYLFPKSQKSRTASTSRPSKKAHLNGHATAHEAGPSTLKAVLDTTQLLTLFLALSRRKGQGEDSWEKYTATIPSSFRPWHPLTWLYPPAGDEEWWERLVGLLPKGVRRKLDDVGTRYEADKDVLRRVLETDGELRRFQDQVKDEDLLWAWLNVNTRTVSIPLDLPSPSDTHNHTLVPILDMINHSSSPSVSRPMQIALSGGIPQKRSYSSALSGSSSPSTASPSGGVPGKIGFRLMAPPGGLREGEEVTFEYGPHCNGTLFAEYGFLLRPKKRKAPSEATDMSNGFAKTKAKDEEEEPSENPWLNTKHGEVDIEHLVNDLTEEIENRAEKLQLVEDMGYLHRYTLHTYPYPPYPSHSLIMTLRIIHLSPAELESKSNPLKSFAIHYISPSNEKSANAALEGMLETAQKERATAVKELQAIMTTGGCLKDESAGKAAVEMVLGLWEEEEAIVDAILSRLKSGDVSW